MFRVKLIRWFLFITTGFIFIQKQLFKQLFYFHFPGKLLKYFVLYHGKQEIGCILLLLKEG